MTHPDLSQEVQLFHRGTFDQKLTEIGGFLAELHHIDTVLDYLVDERSGWMGLPGPAGGLTGVGKVPVTVTLGTTAPFTRTYHVWGSPLDGFSWPVGSSRLDRITQRIQELAVEAETWAANNMESLGTLIEEIVKPDAAVYQHLVDRLVGVYDTLNEEVPDDFAKLKGQLHKWEGDAAETFETHFYEPFKETLRHQRELLMELAGATAGAKAIVQASQHSLMNVVHHLREALHEQLVLRSEDTSFSSNRTVRILADATRDSLGTLAPPYELAEIVIDTVRELATKAESGIPGGENRTLTGRTADELLGSVQDEAAIINERMVDLYDDLNGRVDNVQGKVARLARRSEGVYGDLVPSEPELVGGVDASTFRHVTGSEW